MGMESYLCSNSTSCSYTPQYTDRQICRASAFRATPTPQNVPLITCSRRWSKSDFTRKGVASRIFVRAQGGWNPPAVSETKEKFYLSYKKPIPAVYNTVIQELLVQQHLIRFNKNYKYDEVFGLGFVSVFDQVLDGVEGDNEAIFKAYIGALNEDPSKYRADSEKLAEWAKGLSSSADVKPDSNGDQGQKLLAGIAERAKADKFLYTKFFAIGLFRLLELTGAKDPQSLGSLVKLMGVRQESINRDLMTYKGVLSKLSAAKEMMKEFLEREKKKQAERDAEKKAKAEASQTPAVAADTEKANA